MKILHLALLGAAAYFILKKSNTASATNNAGGFGENNINSPITPTLPTPAPSQDYLIDVRTGAQITPDYLAKVRSSSFDSIEDYSGLNLNFHWGQYGLPADFPLSSLISTSASSQALLAQVLSGGIAGVSQPNSVKYITEARGW